MYTIYCEAMVSAQFPSPHMNWASWADKGFIMSSLKVDLKNLKEIPMRKGSSDGFKGKYYVLPSDESICLAKTCSMCRKVLSESCFSRGTRYTRGLSSACYDCNRKYLDKWNGSNTSRVCSDSQSFTLLVDVSSLSEIKMRKCKGRPQGSYWVDKETGECMARTCAKCMSVKPYHSFPNKSGRKYNLGPTCIECTRRDNRSRKNSPGYRDKISIAAKRKRSANKMRTSDEINADLWRIRPTGTKTCGACRRDKVFDQFYTCRGNNDGLQHLCIPCKHRDWVYRRNKKYERYWASRGIALECYVCGNPWEEPDHVVPKSLGGPDSLDNLMPICIPCNRGKDGKMNSLLLPWLESRYNSTYVSEVIQRCVSAGVTHYLD